MTQAAAGWYDQPDGTKRYWDGNEWTNHVAPAAPTPAPEPVTPEPVTPAPAPEAAPEVTAPAVPVEAAPIAAPATPAATAYTATPAPAKKRKVWPWVLGIGGGLLILIIGGIVALVLLVFNATKGPREAVEGLEDALVAADCDAFQEVTTESFREDVGFADCAVFEETVSTYKPNESTKIHSTEISGSRATVQSTEVWADDPATYEVTYTLIKSGDSWKIDALDYVSNE